MKPLLSTSMLVFACSLFIIDARAQQWANGAGTTIYNANNGNVAISDSGPFTPAKILHLHTTSTTIEQKIETSVDGWASLTLEGNNLAWQWSKRPAAEGNALELWYFNGNWLPAPTLTILPNGSIGVGTTTTGSQMMAVNGPFFATKVTVALGTPPDFVFEKTYRLTPLDSLAAYLSQYHHLPGIPSADDVKKNGFDLGQNEAALLQKVEELTLYTIQQDQAMTRQKAENRNLTNRLNTMEEQITKLQQQSEALSAHTGK